MFFTASLASQDQAQMATSRMFFLESSCQKSKIAEKNAKSVTSGTYYISEEWCVELGKIDIVETGPEAAYFVKYLLRGEKKEVCFFGVEKVFTELGPLKNVFAISRLCYKKTGQDSGLVVCRNVRIILCNAESIVKIVQLKIEIESSQRHL